MTGMNLSYWSLQHRTLMWFFVLVVVIGGFFAYQNLGRNEDPPFTIKVMVVQAAWPGATIHEMIEQVTDRIEKKLQETPRLDYVRSYTQAGRTTIFITLRGSTSSSEVPDIWYQVRKKVNDIRGTLPPGLIGPFFNDEFGDTYGIIYTFTADGFSHRELRDYVEAVRSQLLQVPDVAKIDVFGVQDETIFVEFSARQLAGLNLDRLALIQALQAQNAVTPAGVIQTADEKLLVQVSGRFENEEDLRRVNLVANGQIFRLSDIATVKRGYADPPSPLFRVNGTPAIGLGISMRAGGDVLALGGNVRTAMQAITSNLPVGIEPTLVAEQPQVVVDAVSEFMEALGEAVVIVLAVSFLSLGTRAGAVVAFTIPLVLAAVFVVMDVTGIDLQRVSLGALIIALGLLVDDAMITVEMMMTKLEEGCDRIKAATFAYTSTAFPMLTGTLVTVAAFIPVGFAKSAAGEYTFSLFAVVTIALLISWVVAVLFAPLIGVTLLPANIVRKDHGEFGLITRRFRSLLVLAMRSRWTTIALTLGLLVLSVVALRWVPQQFFPSSDRPELLVDLRLSKSSSIYATDKVAARFESLLKDDPDIDRWTTYVGQGAVRFYLPLNVQLPDDSFSQTVIVTKSLEARERVRRRLARLLSDEFPSVIARLSALELGPPVGWPVQYRVSGPDPNRVREIAYRVAEAMGSDPDAQKINFDWIEPVRTLQMHVDQDQARLLGVSSQALAQALNSVVSGVTVTQVRDGIYPIDVVVRANEVDRVSPSTLRTLEIPLANGKTVPLAQIAKVEYGLDLPLIWRRDRLATITVQADTVGDVLPATIVSNLSKRMAALNATLPPGYRVVVGGSVEESASSTASLAAVLPMAGLLMLVILMAQLQSFSRLFLVLSVAPFGLIGVVFALLLARKPLGFVALLGVIALVGMIVRNSVILVDQIETEIASGRAPWNAVIEATTHRVRPILLTAAAAILGMIPIAPTVFWGPMAYAIMGGLAVATALTLVFLPALYVAWFRLRDQHGAQDTVQEAVSLSPPAGLQATVLNPTGGPAAAELPAATRGSGESARKRSMWLRLVVGAGMALAVVSVAAYFIFRPIGPSVRGGPSDTGGAAGGAPVLETRALPPTGRHIVAPPPEPEGAASGQGSAAAPPLGPDRLTALRAQAARQWQAGNFVAPPGDNAFETYRAILRLEPHDTEAADRSLEIGRIQLGRQALEDAERLLREGRREEALQATVMGLRLAPNDRALSAMRDSLERQNAAGRH
jgi:multidrug efflux pump subunit AcrB